MEEQGYQGHTVIITKSIEFSSAHFYYIKNWTEQKNEEIFGKFYSKHSHGHNYKLEVSIKDNVNEKTGMVINFVDLKKILENSIISVFDHKNLNLDTSYFQDILPTTENLCLTIWKILETHLNKKLVKVNLYEDETLACNYKGEEKMAYMTRIYNFCAAHRLHNSSLTDEENRQIFGKCNNINFHGHNFRLEVTLKGDIDHETGMIYNISKLDKIVNDYIIDILDHKNLNKDIDDLKNTITTGENLIKFIWDRLANKFEPAKLDKIRLYETDRNYFDYSGE